MVSIVVSVLQIQKKLIALASVWILRIVPKTGCIIPEKIVKKQTIQQIKDVQKTTTVIR
jgi:hypothetical protein